MDDLINRYGIPYDQMLHDLAILKMQHMDSLSIEHDSNNSNDDYDDTYDKKLISCYYETIADLNSSLNDYKKTHDF